MLETFSSFSDLQWFGLLHLVIAIPTAIHALLVKEDVGAAISWIAIILISPIIGAVLYFCFGVNRIRRMASHFRAAGPEKYDDLDEKSVGDDQHILAVIFLNK